MHDPFTSLPLLLILSLLPSCLPLTPPAPLPLPSPVLLPLLPFPPSDLLFPGESTQVHLYEARFLSLFSKATTAAPPATSLVGAFYASPLADGGSQVSKLVSILRIAEWERRDVGVWARLTCVSRGSLDSLNTSEQAVYATGDVTAFRDLPPSTDAVSLSFASSAAAELKATLAEVAKLRQRIAFASAPTEPGGSGKIEWGHESRTKTSDWASGADEFRPLQRHLADMREALLARGLDAAPHPSLLPAVREYWGSVDDAAAESELLTFAGCAGLDDVQRWRAFATADAGARVGVGREAWGEEVKRLRAIVALKEATAGFGSKDNP